MLCEYGCGREAKYKLKNNKWCCEQFVTQCPSIKQKNSNGLKKAHTNSNKYININHSVPWNKGLTSETDVRIQRYSEKIRDGFKNGIYKLYYQGKKLSDETKKKISESMIKAHMEGRAHNIGQCRWNNEPSYPEKFFMLVINNEFIDKDYKRELPFHRFSLDFAWVHKKKCIEIDGEQHEKEEQKNRDIEKDRLLLQEGWKVLRLKWIDICNDTKEYIKIARQFIDEF
jgi:very-short-patch-repair endonuclease